MNCPNKNDAFYNQTVQVLGEELAHLVYKRNNYQFLDTDSNGNSSKLFQDILDSVDGDSNKAIKIKANLFSSLFSLNGQYEQIEPTIEEFNEKMNNANKLYAKQQTKAPKAKKNKSVALLIKELNKINVEIFNEKDDNVFKQSRRNRRETIKEEITLLNSAENPFVAVVALANRQLEYFKDTIDKYNPNLEINDITVSEIATMSKLMDIWLNIKDILPVDMRDEDDILLIQSKFDSLNKKFFEVQMKAVISETVINQEIKDIDLTTDLEDRGLLSKFFLNSGRSSNLAIQNINKLLDIAKNNSIRKNNQLKQKLFDINTKIATDKIDISNFIEAETEGATPYLRLVTSSDKFYRMEDNFRKLKNSKAQNQLKQIATFYRDNAITFNIKELFDYDDITGYTVKLNHEDVLEKLANEIETDNKDFAKYLIRVAFDKQKHLLTKYQEELKTKEQLKYNGQITEESYKKWKAYNNPQHFYNTLQNKEIEAYINSTYSVSLPKTSEYINQEFLKIFENEKALEIYDELYNVLKELKRLLPANIRNSLADSFLPIVNQNLIREGLSYLDEAKRLIELPNFSASDNITDYKEIPLRFIPENNNDLEVQKTLKNKTFSTDLVPIISMLGESIHHYYYYTQVKAPVLLTQAILSKSTPFEKNYKGDKKVEGGIDSKHEAGQGLNNEMELLNETINHVMFLEKSKPEFAIGAYYQVEDLTGLRSLVLSDISSVKIDTLNREFHVFSLDELEKEKELIDKIQINLDKDLKVGKLGKFKNKVSRFFEKINKQAKGEEYIQIENLFNMYLSKQDEARQLRREDKITLEEYQLVNDIIFARLKELQRKTVYGSKIGDYLIRQRRSISLGLNPFSAGRNYVGGYFNGIVNGGQEYDNVSFTKHMADIVKLNVSRHFADKDRAFRIYKIAKTLLVDNELIDLQGLDEKDWFSKYGFILMEKSEKAVRYALMLAILEKSNILNLTDKDNLIDRFDKDGNFISNPNDTDNTELNDITLKIQRVNDIVMGDTHSFKLINKNIAGRLIGQFKSSWMPEAISSRLEKESYDYKLDRTIKGRYITYTDLGFTGSLIGLVQSYQAIYFGDNDYIKVKNSKGGDLSLTDVMNMRRNAVEAGLVLGLLTIGITLKYLADDEEDDAMLTFLVNQISLVQRDLTTVSPTTLTEIIGGNLVPAYTVVTNLEAIIPATVHVIADDKYSLDKYLYKLSKVMPVLNIGSQFKYQSEHFVDDLN
jgi:hypothetical protein